MTKPTENKFEIEEQDIPVPKAPKLKPLPYPGASSNLDTNSQYDVLLSSNLFLKLKQSIDLENFGNQTVNENGSIVLNEPSDNSCAPPPSLAFDLED